MNYYTSDLHFSHGNIVKFCDRPWKKTDAHGNILLDDNGDIIPDIEAMDAALIENWNSRITDHDHVYVLGDFCFNKTRFVEFLEKLNGIIHIIYGNHDPDNVYQMTAHLKRKVYFHPLVYTVKDEGRKIVLCHYPIYEWNGYYNGVVHFHGHTHGSIGKNYHTNAFDVGVDCHDYMPRTYEEIVGDNFVQFKFGKGATRHANKTNKPEDRHE